MRMSSAAPVPAPTVASGAVLTSANPAPAPTDAAHSRVRIIVLMTPRRAIGRLSERDDHEVEHHDEQQPGQHLGHGVG